MSAHTPGPWSNHGGFDITAECGVSCVAVTISGKRPNGEFIGVNEQAANSHLISAAPELLDCVRQMVKVFLPKLIHASTDEFLEQHTMFRDVIRVIHKAEGRGA